MRKMTASLVAAIACVFAASASAADSLPLTVTETTPTTITFSWVPPADAVSYKFIVGGQQVSNSQNGKRSTVKFGRAACDDDEDCYVVKYDKFGGQGSYPHKPACSNKKDDDGDTRIDYPADPGCTSAADTDETDPPPPGPATMTPTEFRNACAVGPVANTEVTGSVSLPTNCHATNVIFDGEFNLADGVVLVGCSAPGFYGGNGASNWTIDSCTFDGKGRIAQNEIYDGPNGKVPRNWHILRSSFSNYYIDDGSTHSEALYIGYSDGGEIRGNTFTNNGNTSHIFFTWWGYIHDPGVSWARNICVAGNTFNQTHGAYFDVNFRAEIPRTANIVIQPDASNTNPEFYGTC